VPRMQRPIIVRLHEIPRLLRFACLRRIVFHILDATNHIVGMFKKDIPSVTGNPNGVPFRHELLRAEFPYAPMFQFVRHLLGRVLVLANDEMDVIPHDRTGIASVFLTFDRLAECGCNRLAMRDCKFDFWMFEERVGFLVEVADHRTARLNIFATVVHFAEVLELRVANFRGAAAARIVREPRTVRGPNEVVRDDERILQVPISATPQAAKQTKSTYIISLLASITWAYCCQRPQLQAGFDGCG